MYLKKLTLQNFRNIRDLSVEFSKEINIISGINGQGKTNVLEAIHFLSITRSFKTNTDVEAVNFDVDHFDITGEFKRSENNNDQLRLIVHRKEGKSVLQNKKRVTRFSDIVGRYPVIIFSPETINIVSGGPAERRNWIDISISQINHSYLADLKNLKRVIRQKNALLAMDEVDDRQLKSWNQNLAKLAASISATRIDYLEKIAEIFSRSYQDLVSGSETTHIEYESSVPLTDPGDRTNEEKIFNAIDAKRAVEKRRGVSVFGPHRDDIDFRIDNKSVRVFSSQGQQRTFTAALKIAEYMFLERHLGFKPVFLFDDVFSELDGLRVKKIIQFLSRIGQTIITVTEKDFGFIRSAIKRDIQSFEIEKGVLQPASG